ncbi:MAG TPA: cation diffusion facilitator family transporter [Ignavibacteriaceae bacterium]|nr:cation diffusion facilitator family transporter [Ignavibacteriaceae bacterium]
MQVLKRAATFSIFINILLFIFKGIVGIISNSIAVITDAVNSLTDIAASAAIMFSVSVSLKKPDKEHQFGHRAAQPIAVFLIALFTGVVGFEVTKEAVGRIIKPGVVSISAPVYIVLAASIIIKLVMTRYQSRIGKNFDSPGLRASAVDSLNDVWASSLSLIGVLGVQFGLIYLDGAAGIAIAIFIFHSGYKIAKENIDYLMGKSAGENLTLEIANQTMKIKGIKGFNHLRTYYMGDKIHVEIHVEVDKDLSTDKSHDIGNDVKAVIEKIEGIQKAFVHIDPV